MSVKIHEGTVTTSYKIDDYFAAIAVLGKELDYVRFVGLYQGDDLIELQLDPDSMTVSQITLTSCRHFDVFSGPMPVPAAEEGVLAVAMPKRAKYSDLWMTVYDDGLLIRVVDKLSARYVRAGDVVFGVSCDEDLTSILLTNMTSEEVSHARAELSGEGYDDVWVPAG